MKRKFSDTFLDTYFDFIADPEDLTDDEIDESLISESINLIEFQKRVMRSVEKGLKQWNRTAC